MIITGLLVNDWYGQFSVFCKLIRDSLSGIRKHQISDVCQRALGESAVIGDSYSNLQKYLHTFSENPRKSVDRTSLL
ncbi:hypothetical protein SAMN05216564_10952 [Halopenitus persicus]|uniref:Uncharacterized protein n=1 Tax=Halopenitus persicus TaxID=1048396 RepID=A0A1H3MDJ4_9EURY|nr:hypothetical protein SAMN05216564_10952 [Halopenitus persicus]